MTNPALMRKMTRYTAWADDVMLNNAAKLPAPELTALRDTLFGSITGTFDHVLLIGEIFRDHLEGRSNTHTTRHRAEERAFNIVARELRAMNDYYVALADKWAAEDNGKALNETIRFTFVGGGDGSMTREEILLHLVNHATYHRGFVSTLLYPFRLDGQANDLTVFLRDVWPGLVRTDPSLTQ
ncbi:damage-inducible protein DinB [Hwanghaeella grinnelliae]|uniref:Damage-inducible protein DinB n=1 Tax=Hwanghaeella grinnelliae TaxID=2500179 RepID=A0A437QPT5_9PROT|nr:DinB family protein [Hwanghaeella grinnelliae]RVU36469.1 damage-inducible protein DinB [Hwanghaeella grinnelliae]